MNPPEPQSSHAPELSGDWTDAELSAAVAAYLGMLRCELDGRPYVKADVNKSLRAGPLTTRTKASIEFRMQNISATLYDMRLPHIQGYLPAKNVGSGVKERIKSVLHGLGIADLAAYLPTADTETLNLNVSVLRARSLGRIPPGSTAPARLAATTTSFVRDPAIKAWVLRAAAGVCEGCAAPAPFTDRQGFPYLEVHHVVLLSSGGSDRVSNAVAVCPNCHRRCHHAQDRDEFKLSLYERIPRLRIEAPGFDEGTESVYVD
jgi:5-methylcytosine-specific restriction protein A